MKPIPFNLATQARFRGRWIRLLFLALFLFGLLFTGGSIHRAARLAEKVAAHEDDLRRLQSERAEKEQSRRANKMTVSQEELEATRRHAEWINRRIAQDLFPWCRVLDAVEDGLPETLYLTRVIGEEGGRRWRLEGFAASLEPVSGYLQKKEAAALFDRIVLENVEVDQENAEADGPPPVAFEIESRLQPRRAFPPEVYGPLWRTLLPESNEGREMAPGDKMAANG
ncbi:MAG: hypothetical protein ACLFQQ_19765 [Desulfococcaceae bacterium]